MKGHIEKRVGKDGSKSWRLTVSTGEKDPSGRYIRERETISGTLSQAQRRLREMIQQIETGEYISRKQAGTVNDVLAQWLESVAVRSRVSGTPRARTVETYRLIATKYVMPSIGNVTLRALDPSRVERFHADLSQTNRKDGQPLSSVTLGHCHRVLSMALRHAVKLGKIKSNPAASVGSPPKKRAQVETVAPATAARIFAELERTTPVAAAAAKLALASGARRSEVCALDWSDVNFAEQYISITKAYVDSKAGPEMVETKTKKSRRRAAVPSHGLEALIEWKRASSAAAQAFGASLDTYEPIFQTADGLRLKPQSLSKAWRRACARVGVNVKFHALRHTFATTALEAGVPLAFVSNQLGHASITITADTYGHVADSFGQHAADAVGVRFASAFGGDNAGTLGEITDHANGKNPTQGRDTMAIGGTINA